MGFFILLLVVSEVLPFVARLPGNGIIHAAARYAAAHCQDEIRTERAEAGTEAGTEADAGPQPPEATQPLKVIPSVMRTMPCPSFNRVPTPHPLMANEDDRWQYLVA